LQASPQPAKSHFNMRSTPNLGCNSRIFFYWHYSEAHAFVHLVTGNLFRIGAPW
jgi:hypothetical protein